ncbi:hypothetical protein HDV63DRAFT_368541 [Trichoderma sp. SZMC 28014]
MSAQTLKAAYYRGGSSKAVFLLEDDIPPPGDVRDALIKRLIGAPDPLQIDGMGGSRVVSSKVAIIRKSTRDEADVDYTFAQIGITDGVVRYDNNCGNISSAVGPFAITAGLVDKFRGGAPSLGHKDTQEVRIYNTGTKKLLVAHVPVDSKTGGVVEEGDFSIAGVPGTGAPILLDYSGTIGATLGKSLLPTQNITDTIQLGENQIPITICDVANLIVFVKAADVGMTGSETPDEINSNPKIVKVLSEVRGKGSMLVGRCSDWTRVDEQSPFIPLVAVMSPATESNGHLSVRLMLDNRCHESVAGTGSVCIAACSRIRGSVAHRQIRPGVDSEPILQLQHPRGVMPVSVSVKEESQGKDIPIFQSLSFVRTARRIMSGELHVPTEVQFTPQKVNGVQNGHAEQTPPNVTEELCQFVADLTYEMIDPKMVAKIKELVIDQIGVAVGAAQGAESSEPFVKAVSTLQGTAIQGGSTVFTKGKTWLPQFAGMLNAAFVHTFDFDDTDADAIVHPGASVVPSVLAAGELANCDGKTLITAFTAAYEIICRIGRALGLGSYERGFHNTGTVGILGAVAGISKVRGLDAKQIANAFGLAGSFASGSMQFLENGSWNKRLHPAMAVHNAFIAVTMAEAGVLGSAKPLEGKWGMLHAYSTSATLEGLTDNLGKEWKFAKTAIKPWPACRMTHTSIQMVDELSTLHKGKSVKKIQVELSPGCWNIVGMPKQNKIHPQCIVDAQFSLYYQIAVSWLYGIDLQWRVYDLLTDKKLNELTEKIEILSNEDVVTLEARMQVEWEDGTKANRAMVFPLGEPENPLSRDGIYKKFLGLVSHIYGDEKAQKIIATVENLESAHAQDLMSLL